MKFYFCQECHKRIKDGEVVLKVEEAETGKIVYLAHKECANEDLQHRRGSPS